MANIILVDSDKAVARVIADLLKVEGHTFRHTGTSKGLVTMLGSADADLIFVGIQVDDEDGRELCHRMYEEKINKRIPVILVSPYFHTEAEVRKFHCVDVISVPLEGSAIIHAVETFAKQGTKQLQPAN